MNSGTKTRHAKRREGNEEGETKDSTSKHLSEPRTKSSVPSSPGSAADDGIILTEEAKEDLQEHTSVMLKIGPAANSSHEHRLGPRFLHFGAIEDIIRHLTENVVIPLRRRLMPVTIGVGPLSGIIIHGPSGCGKTSLAKAIGNETGLPFHRISAAEVIAGESGTTMKKIIEEAHRSAPSILFIDDLNAIGSREDSLHKRRSKRLVKQMIACMDRSIQALYAMNTNLTKNRSEGKSGYVLVIGATNKVDSLEQELRSPGYFDREIHLRIPEERDRHEILLLLTLVLKRDDTVDLAKIARTTTGFVGADLKAVVDEAGRLAEKRLISQILREIPFEQRRDWWYRAWPREIYARLRMSMVDFEEAVLTVRPAR